MDMDHPMGHSGMSHSDMDMSSSMAMTFSNSHDTPLFSKLWTPTSDGSYAGTCIFLIILSIIDRCLFAFKAIMERRWLATHLNHRHIASTDKIPEAERANNNRDTQCTTLVTAQGKEESVKIVQQAAPEVLPWRFSIDLPRALIALCIAGVSNLLMLAVMTMNVGYFCSVLAGAFLGELGVRRYI